MRVLVIDNYDSFTYNLVHLLEAHPAVQCTVMKNNAIDWNMLTQFNAAVLSPGPGIPQEAGDLMHCITLLKDKMPVLGICLGMQALGQYFGAQLINLKQVFHGIARPVFSTSANEILFKGCSNPFMAGRYHSWGLAPESVKAPLTITAHDDQGLVMGIRHQHYNICGLQFHPESVLSPEGQHILHNWIHHNAHRTR